VLALHRVRFFQVLQASSGDQRKAAAATVIKGTALFQNHLHHRSPHLAVD
jgi:hypothetical protein